eukprot:jgi/Mesen1/3130/ME000184S02188
MALALQLPYRAACTGAVAVGPCYSQGRRPRCSILAVKFTSRSEHRLHSRRSNKSGVHSPLELIKRKNVEKLQVACRASGTKEAEDQVLSDSKVEQQLECVATGIDVECVLVDIEGSGRTQAADAGRSSQLTAQDGEEEESTLASVLGILLLISPFFFWGTAMVAMKDVLPKAGPMFVAATRLIPAGAMLVGFASWRGRPMPSTPVAWLAICTFALVDAACFQGFLAQGLSRTTAGLGSVIIDSQPLTVAVLAALLFGEAIGPLGVLGLALGVLGLTLLEVDVDTLTHFLPGAAPQPAAAELVAPGGVPAFSLWDSGEWWMLLAAQSMAVGTVMVRWVCRFCDPIQATGWHMIVGGVPLVVLSSLQHDPALSGHLGDLSLSDWASLTYTSVFGSAVSYGVFFYNANKGNLTRLSSLTFLTPMFAALFGYFYLGETLSSWQLVGASVTLASIYLVNYKPSDEKVKKS